MAYAYVLYIDDKVVGPCLELIRRIGEPQSTSKPHITVRYPVNILGRNNLSYYETASILEVDILGPSSFLSKDKSKITVFVQCDSDELMLWEYKPKFPFSIFHVTLYDGHDLTFGTELLRIIKQFDWQFSVRLPADTKLTRISIGKTKDKRERKVGLYSQILRDIFKEATGESLSIDYLEKLSSNERLSLCMRICEYLNKATLHFRKVSRPNIGKSYDPNEIEHESDPQSPALTRLLDVDDLPVVASGDARKARGMDLFLTPPELAVEITECALGFIPSSEEIDFGDPAVGNGVFFSALHYLAGLRMGSAIGVEIDPGRCEAARRRLAHKGLEVFEGDYLHLDDLPHRSLILANPPYKRYQDLRTTVTDKWRGRISKELGISVSGQASLYVYFLLLSHLWMRDGAVAAWLVPSEFLETKYGKAIRQYLVEKVELLRIHTYSSDSVQFENAFVSSTVLIFRKASTRLDCGVALTSGGSLNSPFSSQEVACGELARSDKWRIPWISSPTSNDDALLLGDVFEVQRGIATGANEFFIMEREIARSRNLDESVLKPLLPKARVLATDIVEDAGDGYPDVHPQLCLLDTGLDWDTLKRLYPSVASYLESAGDDVRNASLVKRRRPWYQQEQRLPAPFLCTYMGRGGSGGASLRFIRNKSKALATNTYLLLRPIPPIVSAIESGLGSLEELFSLLNSITVESLELSGRSYVGGLHKIEPRELLSVSLSSVPEWVRERVVRQSTLILDA